MRKYMWKDFGKYKALLKIKGIYSDYLFSSAFSAIAVTNNPIFYSIHSLQSLSLYSPCELDSTGIISILQMVNLK